MGQRRNPFRFAFRLFRAPTPAAGVVLTDAPVPDGSPSEASVPAAPADVVADTVMSEAAGGPDPTEPPLYNAIPTREAKYQIGQIVRHRLFDFRGVIFDVDPVFANTDEWYDAIPEEVRPKKDQPYYHLFAENERTHYVAYVSEQNLTPDDSTTQIAHPDIAKVFECTEHGYVLKPAQRN
jgi:heat shock protein HspQ